MLGLHWMQWLVEGILAEWDIGEKKKGGGGGRGNGLKRNAECKREG